MYVSYRKGMMHVLFGYQPTRYGTHIVINKLFLKLGYMLIVIIRLYTFQKLAKSYKFLQYTKICGDTKISRWIHFSTKIFDNNLELTLGIILCSLMCTMEVGQKKSNIQEIIDLFQVRHIVCVNHDLQCKTLVSFSKSNVLKISGRAVFYHFCRCIVKYDLKYFLRYPWLKFKEWLDYLP